MRGKVRPLLPLAGKLLSGQMMRWQLESVLNIVRKLPLKLGQKWVCNRWDIADIEFHVKCLPQKCATIMFGPHVPQMWYMCGTQKRAQSFLDILGIMHLMYVYIHEGSEISFY